MEKTIKTFKHFSEKGYKHYTENTIEELDELPLDNHYIITEFAHLCEWLRINHGIWISVDINPDYDMYFYAIRKTKGSGQRMRLNDEVFYFNSPQEVYSAAFDYILKKLI